MSDICPSCGQPTPGSGQPGTQGTPTVFRNFREAADRMAQMVVNASRDPEVINFAKDLVQPVKGGWFINEAKRICDWVQQKVRYTNETFNEDIFRYPLAIIKAASPAGDCDCKCILFGALARAVGFPVRFVFAFRDSSPNLDTEYPEHVWIECEVNKGTRADENWVPCECTPVPEKLTGWPSIYLPFGQAANAPAENLVYYPVD